jgi:hypothetical protein
VFDYPLAGKHAQPEVRAAIKRWRARVPVTVKSRLPLLYWLLGEGTPPFKMPKPDAAYGPPPAQFKGTQRCSNCRFAYAKVINPQIIICSQIEGRIQPQLWCRLWKA